jgi:hypothetical protein
LPIGSGAAGSSINVVANRRHALFTHGTDQFAAYYDTEGFMVLAQRRLNSDVWGTLRTGEKGQVADAHNSISIAVDGDGFLHVAWDHHGGSLKYARGKKPLSLELQSKQPMTGLAENAVTYPEFYALADGDLLCLYRDGASGKGDLVLNRYRTAQRRWVNIQPNLISGEGQRSAYWGAHVDQRGGLHLTWIWRESPDVASNHDIAYAFSADGGIQWTSIMGEKRSPPFTQARSDYAARIPMHRNLMNSPWMTADRNGKPYIVSYWSEGEASAPQFRMLRHDGSTWLNERITDRRDTFKLAGAATRRPPISRGVLLVEAQGTSAHLVYRDDAEGGRALVSSTQAIGSGRWTQQELTRNSLGAWEPVIDPVQWDRHQQIHLLMQIVQQRDGDDASYADAASPVGALLFDPNQPLARPVR